MGHSRRQSLVGLLLALGLTTAPIRAQRVVRLIEPPSDHRLKFDVNSVPLTTLPLAQASDLNYSPNVVFSGDSSRGFVSYPGREEEDEEGGTVTTEGNQVMAFDVQTGEVVGLIEVGGTPAHLSVTPDSKQVAVVSLFLHDNTPNMDNEFQAQQSGAVSLIDVETLQARTLQFSQVGFSFFNNVVFSSDGSTGFVASAATDEIIRFDVASMSEISRLQMDEGTRPSSITMAHDGSFFVVVLPGSLALPVDEVADSIQLIDTTSFTVLGSVVPEPRTANRPDGTSVEVPHDFFALNNVAITGDNRYAIIGDRETSSVSQIPELARDHVLVVDLESREVVQVRNVSGGAAATVSSPTGNLLALVTATTVVVVEPSKEFVVESGSSFSQFRGTSRPVFSREGKQIFVAAPILDLINIYNSASGSLSQQIVVGEDFQQANAAIPAAPMDLSFSPDGEYLTVVDFNANAVEVLRNTFKLRIPSLIAQNVSSAPGEGGELEPIPAAERFFSGVAVSNPGEQEAEVILTAEGLVEAALSAADVSIAILAAPNPVQVCETGGLGQTTIAWNAGEEVTEVEVRLDAPDGNLFTDGESTGSAETGEWVTNGMVFYLINKLNGEVIDTVTVTHTERGCPPPVVTASPNPIQVCDGSLGTTTLTWDTTDSTDEVRIRVGTSDGSVVAEGEAMGSFQTGRWVRDGMVFYLLDQTNGNELDTVTVSVNDTGCPLQIEKILQPNEQIRLTPQDFLNTNASLESDVAQDFSGWAVVDSNQPDLAGLFLTYDGALNRLDGGAPASELLQRAILPEVRVGDGFRTQVEIVNPGLTQVGVLFDLFDDSGRVVASSSRTLPPRDREVISLLKDTRDPNSIGLFDDGGFVFIAASPAVIQSCDGAPGMTTISWDVRGRAEEVEVRVGTPDGNLFASGDAIGSGETGEWVTDGMVFLLIDASNGEVLDSVTVRLNQIGCPAPNVVAIPNPIQVCDDSGVGRTLISWEATDVAEETEIRFGSVDGTVFQTGGPTGSAVTGIWVRHGTTFYLLNKATGEELDRTTVRLTQDDCALLGFTDGYIRMASQSFVAFEQISDSERLAILPALPLEDDATRFTVPLFLVFQGSDTTLKLIHPSNAPLGGLEDPEAEPAEPSEPLNVTVRLRANDGSTIAQPVMLELAEGVAIRQSVVDLFGLEDEGSLQTGWIEIVSDRPGLLGAAEFQVFDGRAMSAVPLQPVRDSKLVYPHVAQGLGFSTGLAVVNSEDQVAEVTIELREADSTLVGTLGPEILQPGQRLIGLLPELFPQAGDVIGGTIKVISDQPVTSLMMFYTNDLKIISVVPSAKFE